MVSIMSTTINGHHDGELLGLNVSNNEHSCKQHKCCGGKVVKPVDVSTFKQTVVKVILGNWLEAIKAFTMSQEGQHRTLQGWISGEGSCCIAFTKEQVHCCLDKITQLLELYDDAYSMMRKKAEQPKCQNGFIAFDEAFSRPGIVLCSSAQ